VSTETPCRKICDGVVLAVTWTLAITLSPGE
jgi:hypothetical protein